MATNLPQLAEVETICESPRILRILGGNPSKFTLQGTNTYLLGTGPERILIDTAQGLPSWSAALARVLASESATISQVFLTHWHPDHIGGVPHILSSIKPPPEIYENEPSYLGGSTSSSDDAKTAGSESSQAASMIRASGLLPSLHCETWQTIETTQTFSIPYSTSDTNPSHFKLRALHTPGHTRDHMTFLLLGKPPTVPHLAGDERHEHFVAQEADVRMAVEGVFTGDNVLGHGTAVFEDLGVYLESLEALGKMLPPLPGDDFESHESHLRPREVPFYPGHGAVVANGQAKLREYIEHREQRAQQVLAALEGGSERGMKPREVVGVVYKDVSEELWGPAEGGVRLILGMLEGKARVESVEGGRWRVKDDQDGNSGSKGKI